MVLAGVERHLVRGRVAEFSALRRRCSHCQSLRSLKDTRARRLGWSHVVQLRTDLVVTPIV